MNSSEYNKYFDSDLELDTSLTSALQKDLDKLIQSSKSLDYKYLKRELFIMQNNLKKYFSFISVFTSSGEYLLSSLDANSKEMNFAKEVYNTIRINEQIEDLQLTERESIYNKILGDIVIFYFKVENYLFFLFSIKKQINVGIIKLKLLAYLKQNYSNLISALQNNEQMDEFTNIDAELNASSVNNDSYQIKMTIEF